MSKLFLNAPAEAAHGWPQAGDVMQSSSSPGLQIVSLFTEQWAWDLDFRLQRISFKTVQK